MRSEIRARPGVRRVGLASDLLTAGLLTAALPVASCLAATVEVTVSGISPGDGLVLASLCSGGLDQTACQQGQRHPAEARVVTFVFHDVEPGRYAAIAFQDTEGSGTLRRSRMGRPLEPYGLSNGAGRARQPTFEQAAVRVGADGARIAIKLDRSGSP